MEKRIEKKAGISPAVILVILVAAAVAAPISLNKVSPIAPNLMEYFKIGETKLGMLISVFSLTGIILALPGGIIVQKIGHWKAVLIAMFTLIFGSLIGIFSGSFTLLLLGRVIEGIGMVFISIAGPSIIGATISSKRRGVAMGLFSAYMGIGQVVIYNLAPRIIGFGGWKVVWWFSTAYTGVFTLIWIILMFKLKTFSRDKDEKFNSKSVVKSVESTEAVKPFYSVIKDKSLWYLFIAMSFYIISYVTIQMFLPSYLVANRSMNMTKASSLVSIMCFLGTIFSLVAGIISDKLGSRRVLGGLSLIFSALLFALIPITPKSLFMPLNIILGLIPPILPVCVFAAASEVIDDPAKSSIAMGLITMGQNLGFAIGPIIFGAITQRFSWDTAFLFTVPIAIIGGIFMLLNRRVR